MAQNIWFTSDTHIHHKNIIKHCPQRAEIGGFGPDDLDAHDKWLMDIWNNTVAKQDLVYILGDFSFYDSETLKKKILPKLNGTKFLILGNHDKSSLHLDGYFQQITQIKEVNFKKANYNFLEEDFQVVLCHYPMITWNRKMYGVAQLHGHTHGRLDEYNTESQQLRVDVGWDSKLGNYNLISLEKVYRYMKGIATSHGYSILAEYANNERIIR